MKKKFNVLMLSALFIIMGCSKGDFKEGKTFIGNQSVNADTLNLGKQVYTEYCMACHGVKGDGNGPAAKGSIPPPRNFTQGLYKFGLVADGGLPTDEDFKRIIQGGLHGTAMFAWDISEQQTYAVTQYIKTFAPQVWESKDEYEVGTPIKISQDPYGLARKNFAIKKGKAVYHVVTNCQTCHRGYVTKSELNKISKEYTGSGSDGIPEDFYDLKLQESEYYFHDSKERYAKYLPPDFTLHPVRSASSVEELYARIAAGVTGTGMPAWKGTIEEDELWAVAYYLKWLSELKDSPERVKLMDELK